jgi:hypothetical protein
MHHKNLVHFFISIGGVFLKEQLRLLVNFKSGIGCVVSQEQKVELPKEIVC